MGNQALLVCFLCHLCHFEEKFFKNGKRVKRARLLNLLKPMPSIYAKSIHTLALRKFPLTRVRVPKVPFRVLDILKNEIQNSVLRF